MEESREKPFHGEKRFHGRKSRKTVLKQIQERLSAVSTEGPAVSAEGPAALAEGPATSRSFFSPPTGNGDKDQQPSPDSTVRPTRLKFSFGDDDEEDDIPFRVDRGRTSSPSVLPTKAHPSRVLPTDPIFLSRKSRVQVQKWTRHPGKSRFHGRKWGTAPGHDLPPKVRATVRFFQLKDRWAVRCTMHDTLGHTTTSASVHSIEDRSPLSL